MILDPADNLSSAIDINLVTQGVTEFSILCRKVSIYPRHHPSIAPSARKVVNLFNRITAGSGSITIGIARDALLVNDTPLERKNPVFQSVAKAFFAHEIAVVKISPYIEIDELLAFIGIINTAPGIIAGRGGIVLAVDAAGISGIQVTAIDYGAFRLTEEEFIIEEAPVIEERKATLLWERFVRGLINDVLDQEGELAVSFSRIDPVMLAELINRQQGEAAEGRTLSYSQAIVQFCRKAKQGGCGDEIDRVGEFINQLEPELRREFLISTIEALKGDRKLAGQFLTGLSDDAVLDALVEMNNRGETVSPYLRTLMERLSSLGPSENLIPAASDSDGYDKTGLVDKLKSIFQNDQAELFLPVDYQALISSIIATGEISGAEMEERELLLASLVGNSLEQQVNGVILNLIEQPSGEDRPEVLKQHVADMLSYFLDIGDYAALCRIYNRLSGNIENLVFRKEILDLFASTDFINEVLDSIPIWGKAKYGDIQSLISLVGTPFLNPTLDKLAEEESMSLRRFYMERLREFGNFAVESAVARLRDDRWYVVRNMLVLLRTLEASQTVNPVRRLLSHSHPRVRQEVLRNLIYFQDPEADRQLLQDLKNDSQDIQLAALQLAESSKNPQVSVSLLELVKNSGDFVLKNAAVQSLAIIGNPAVLPELGQFLKTGSILHPFLMRKLKLEIIRSLERYPALPATQLLAKIPELGNRKLTSLAEEISGKLQARRT